MGKIQTDKMRYNSLFEYINEHDPWLLAKWLHTPEGKGVVE